MCGGDVCCLAMSIVNHCPLHLVRPRVTTAACGLCPVKRCKAPFALSPAFLARPSAVQLCGRGVVPYETSCDAGISS